MHQVASEHRLLSVSLLPSISLILNNFANSNISNLSPHNTGSSCSDSLLQQQIDTLSRQNKDMSLDMLEMEEQLHILTSQFLHLVTLGSQQEGTLPSLQTTIDDANTVCYNIDFKLWKSSVASHSMP